MKQWFSSFGNVARAAILAAVVVVATFSLGRSSDTAFAADPEIFFSYANFAPIFAPTIVLNPNSGPVTMYIWAKDVPSANGGASAFQLNMAFNGALIDMGNLAGSSTWLAMNGRSASCPVVDTDIGENSATTRCITLGGVPPWGASGSGLLGSLTLTPGELTGGTVLNLGGSYLVDTPVHPDDWQYIDVTLRSPGVALIRCADFSGDGVVSLQDDILSVILRYGMTSSHPNWDPKYDLNDNNAIDLTVDILGTILQFQKACTQDP